MELCLVVSGTGRAAYFLPCIEAFCEISESSVFSGVAGKIAELSSMLHGSCVVRRKSNLSGQRGIIMPDGELNK